MALSGEPSGAAGQSICGAPRTPVSSAIPAKVGAAPRDSQPAAPRMAVASRSSPVSAVSVVMARIPRRWRLDVDWRPAPNGGSDKCGGIPVDGLIAAAAQALGRGDPLAALNQVALREDAPALALRGIAMAQLG